MPQCGIDAFWSFGTLVISYNPMTIPLETVWNDITFWGQSKFGEDRLINYRLGVAAASSMGVPGLYSNSSLGGIISDSSGTACGSLRNDLILKAICFGGFFRQSIVSKERQNHHQAIPSVLFFEWSEPIVHMIVGTLQFGYKVFPFKHDLVGYSILGTNPHLKLEKAYPRCCLIFLDYSRKALLHRRGYGLQGIPLQTSIAKETGCRQAGDWHSPPSHGVALPGATFSKAILTAANYCVHPQASGGLRVRRRTSMNPHTQWKSGDDTPSL